jgi:hypothetical protein
MWEISVRHRRQDRSEDFQDGSGKDGDLKAFANETLLTLK